MRFVHIVDESGEIVLQADESLGAIIDGEIRTELLIFDTSTLADGRYLVRTGWYDFNTLTNYVSDDGQETIVIGQFER